MRLWFGLSAQEVEIDWRDPQFVVFIPRSGCVSTGSNQLVLPDGETDYAYIYNLIPRDRGTEQEDYREWVYRFTYPWMGAESRLRMQLYRRSEEVWGLFLVPPRGLAHHHIIPEEMAGDLEESFESAPKFYVVHGGLHR
jgi:hypothetical protein